MNTDKLFREFNNAIELSDSKREKLKNNRNTIRDRIKGYHEEHGLNNPSFYSQGSFPLRTNLNPIKEEAIDGSIKEKYDLDDGVYFTCSEGTRKGTSAYHDQIKKAVEGHTESLVDKNTCVRVIYKDGHHIDLPIYWMEQEGDTPELAHKSEGFIKSDPREFKQWVDQHISQTDNTGQLRRVIRYFKAWKNYRENSNSNIKLPSGFILTILACNHFSENDRDDLSFKETSDSIEETLRSNFACYRPTTPKNEELLKKYNCSSVMDELGTLSGNARSAIDSKSAKDTSEYWRKIFGDRFPLGGDNESNSSKGTADIAGPSVRTKVTPPWRSN